MAAMLKAGILPYLCNCLTNFDERQYGNALCILVLRSSEPDVKLSIYFRQSCVVDSRNLEN